MKMKTHIRSISSATLLSVILININVALAQTAVEEPIPSTIEPASAARTGRDKDNATLTPDNTGRNIRDRDGATLTPLNQGNSKADVDRTAQIRKDILARKNMSLNANNVKIITIGHFE